MRGIEEVGDCVYLMMLNMYSFRHVFIYRTVVGLIYISYKQRISLTQRTHQIDLIVTYKESSDPMAMGCNKSKLYNIYSF